MIVEWNTNKLHKINKKLDEMTKVFQGFRSPKKGGDKPFCKKAYEYD